MLIHAFTKNQFKVSNRKLPATNVLFNTKAIRKSHHPNEKGELLINLAANTQLFCIVKILKQKVKTFIRDYRNRHSCFCAAAFGSG